eukprot:6221653-Pyramimonas_sp.AAC.1
MEKRGVLTVALNTQDLETARTLWPILMEYLVKVEQCEPILGAAPRGPTEMAGITDKVNPTSHETRGG